MENKTNYIGSQQQWEDSVNADYERKEREVEEYNNNMHKEYYKSMENNVDVYNLPVYSPVVYLGILEQNIEYGTYLVVRKDGKTHLETFNGTGWAYNNNSIVAYYLPKIN